MQREKKKSLCCAGDGETRREMRRARNVCDPCVCGYMCETEMRREIEGFCVKG